MAELFEDASEIGTRARKSIPEARDRWQSRLLAPILAAAILAFIAFGLLATGEQGGRYKIAGVSLALAAVVALMRSATVGGALSGAIACFCMTWWTRDLQSPLGHSALAPLIALSAFIFASTRAGRQQKQLRSLEERRGGRTSAQVLANLGVAALVVTPLGAYASALVGLHLPVAPLLLSAACLAALAEATADTVSSEIGQAFGNRTYMLTSLRRVHRGTDGGVSLPGTAAGVAGALFVVLIGSWSLRLDGRIGALVLLATVIGFAADSLLGATLERRGWIGNDVVNLSSTAAAALSLFLLARVTSAFQ